MTYSKTDKGRHRLRLSLHLTTSSSATATRDALFPPAGEPDSPAARPPRRRPSSYPSFSAMLPPDWQLPDDSPTLERPSAIITSPPSVPGPAGLPSPAHAKPSLTYKSRPEGFRLLTTATSKLRPLGSAILSSSGSRRRTSRTRTVIIALSTVALATLLLLATANDRPGLNFAFAVRETVDRLGCLGRHGRAQLLNAASGGDKSDAGRWATETNSWAETKILLHAPGWTTFENLYQLNGTLYVVSSRPDELPSLRKMISSGAPVGNSDEERAATEPSESDMQVITPAKAAILFSNDAAPQPLHLTGLSWIVNDPVQFLNHYYHWAAELVYGVWRSTVALIESGSISADGTVEPTSRLEMPRRMVLRHVVGNAWQDYSGMNALLMRAVFPRTELISAEVAAKLASSGQVVIYERAIIADRAAASRGNQFERTSRTSSEAFVFPSKAWWWAPIRRMMLNHVGPGPQVAKPGKPTRPVITYVSRQNWNRRKLLQADHEALVQALEDASEEEGWEFVVADMETLSLEEQVRLAGRTTVMMGVHGNGLTHLLWMEPKPASTVLEFFIPGGWAMDYEFTARSLGLRHYGMWDDRAMTAPDTPPAAYPEGFQGDAIPIDAEAVLRIVRMRLNYDEEADDG